MLNKLSKTPQYSISPDPSGSSFVNSPLQQLNRESFLNELGCMFWIIVQLQDKRLNFNILAGCTWNYPWNNNLLIHGVHNAIKPMEGKELHTSIDPHIGYHLGLGHIVCKQLSFFRPKPFKRLFLLRRPM